MATNGSTSVINLSNTNRLRKRDLPRGKTCIVRNITLTQRHDDLIKTLTQELSVNRSELIRRLLDDHQKRSAA